MTNALTAILDERGQTHGDYEVQTYYSQAFKDVLYDHKFRNRGTPRQLPPMVYDNLEMIVFKASRVLAGDPYTKEHWIDIAGYALLMAKKCDAVAEARAAQKRQQQQEQAQTAQLADHLSETVKARAEERAPTDMGLPNTPADGYVPAQQPPQMPGEVPAQAPDLPQFVKEQPQGTTEGKVSKTLLNRITGN